MSEPEQDQLATLVEHAVEQALSKAKRDAPPRGEAFSPRFLFSVCMAGVAVIVWLVRLEGKIEANSERVASHKAMPYHDRGAETQVALAKIDEKLKHLAESIGKLELGQEDLKKKLGAE